MITISLRTYSSHIQSLLHFNYPYYAESGDGLTDEIGAFTWSRSGSAKLVGSEIPADQIIAGTPKFGYRCLHTASTSDFITGTRSTALTLPFLEFSFWVRLSATSANANVLTLSSGSSSVITVTFSSDNRISVFDNAFPGNDSGEVSYSRGVSSEVIPLNTWTYVRINAYRDALTISTNNGTTYYADSKSAPSDSRFGRGYTFSSIKLGGFQGQIDEFIFRDTETFGLPNEPEKAVCNVTALGGFGSGSLGNVTLTSGCVINSCATFVGVKKTSSGYATVSQVTGKFGMLKVGDEVMLLNMATGEYQFRTITKVSGTYINFNTDPSSQFNSVATQIIQIPHFNTLTVNAGVKIIPASGVPSSVRGIIAFRCKGNCTINGSLITSGYGRPRTDMLQLTHSKLIDNFITNTGGGIFITCGGTFTAGANARLGAEWSGAGKGGSPVLRSKGGNGGAGYGGAGGSDVDNNGLGGNGGVGGGGGGGDGRTGGDAGTSGTGGYGIELHTGEQSQGGTQGKTTGGNSPSGTGNSAGATYYDSGGGGAGGASGSIYDYRGAYSGANIILITQTLKVDSAALSTGGEGGYSTINCTGGGGTGFCYIACERMI